MHGQAKKQDCQNTQILNKKKLLLIYATVIRAYAKLFCYQCPFTYATMMIKYISTVICCTFYPV